MNQYDYWKQESLDNLETANILKVDIQQVEKNFIIILQKKYLSQS